MRCSVNGPATRTTPVTSSRTRANRFASITAPQGLAWLVVHLLRTQRHEALFDEVIDYYDEHTEYES